MRTRDRKKIPNWVIGLVMIVVLAVASYAAFTKSVPWGGGTEVQAVFKSAQNLRPNSPVRIAGVQVGKVTEVEPLDPDSEGDEDAAAGSAPTGAVVTMELDDDAFPIKEDAQFTLKPRLFLEGNLFVDVKPGSPSSPEIDPEDFTFPPSQTANTVQLDQILTGSFQADARKNLQIFLDQFGTALVDAGGAQSLRTLNKVSPGAFRYTSEVNQALLGENPHDLSGLIVNLDRVVRSLNASGSDLADLITNLRVTTGSFAQQSVPLEAAIQELPNTIEAGNTAFASLNASFPATRAFAREILPGVRTAPATLDAATPLLYQLKLLARPQELRGLVSDLRPTVPKLAKLTRKTIPFLKQARALQLLQQRDHPVGQRPRHGWTRLRRHARSEGQDLRGDGLWPRGNRRREPLRRCKRPVHPRGGGRWHQHGRHQRPVDGRDTACGSDAVPDRRRDPATQLLGEDAVPPRRPV